MAYVPGLVGLLIVLNLVLVVLAALILKRQVGNGPQVEVLGGISA